MIDDIDTDKLLAGLADQTTHTAYADELVKRVRAGCHLILSRDRDAISFRIVCGPKGMDTLRETTLRVAMMAAGMTTQARHRKPLATVIARLKIGGSPAAHYIHSLTA